MKYFARWMCLTAIVVAAMSMSVFAQTPNMHPTTVPTPRKKPVAQAGVGGNPHNAGLKTKTAKEREKAEKERTKAVKEAKKRAKKAKKQLS
jgi:hypothetical protein